MNLFGFRLIADHTDQSNAGGTSAVSAKVADSEGGGWEGLRWSSSLIAAKVGDMGEGGGQWGMALASGSAISAKVCGGGEGGGHGG